MGNVRPLRPMRVLLVTTDLRYADEVFLAADSYDIQLVRLDPGVDLEDAVRSTMPNAVVIDSQDTVARAARLADVIAALHPRVTIVLVAEHAREQVTGNLRVIDRWRSADRLVGELRRQQFGAEANDAARWQLRSRP